MSNDERTQPDKLKAEAIDVLRGVRERITDDSDFTWSSFHGANDFRAEIDKCIAGLERGDAQILEAVHTHFLPSLDFQEHAVQNGWNEAYFDLSNRFDKIYTQLKPLLT